MKVGFVLSKYNKDRRDFIYLDDLLIAELRTIQELKGKCRKVPRWRIVDRWWIPWRLASTTIETRNANRPYCETFKEVWDEWVHCFKNSHGERSEDVTTTKPYRELLGRLMYVMMSSRPDRCYPIGYCTQASSAVSSGHEKIDAKAAEGWASSITHRICS